MIIQSLSAYYNRVVDEPNSNIPEPGFCHQGIHFCLTLSPEGALLGQPLDLRGEKQNPSRMIVPIDSGGTVNVSAKFLWGNTAYVLGSDPSKKANKVKECFNAFKELHHTIGDAVDDPGMKAVIHFVDGWDPLDAKDLFDWDEVKKRGANIVFKLDGETEFIHDKKAIRDAWVTYWKSHWSKVYGMCLVNGEENAPITRTHAKIKGVPGAQSSGAALISFNIDSFKSFGKNQNFNAPIGESAAFAYTAALNDLLSKESRQKVRIGDTVCIFWTEKSSPVESFMAGLLDPSLFDDQSDSQKQDLRIFLESVSKGRFPKELNPDNNRFYILGLSPNAARLSVRFFYTDTVEAISLKIGRHFQDLEIVKNYENEPSYPSLWQILKETAAQKDSKNIQPILPGQLMHALLTGHHYPHSLLSTLVGRIRVDKSVNYIRAAMLKAILIRNKKMEVTVMLNQESKESGYCLGRLFAVLEKAQEEAIPGTNTTIKDQYFSSASATPGLSFPVLMRKAQHNISKLKKGEETKGRAIHMDRLISDIICKIESFPKTLSLEDQGRFAIGYYHQRKDFFTSKKETSDKGGNTDDSNQ